jgi:hypothetical protein
MKDDIEKQIGAVLKRYGEGFLAGDADALIQLWEPDSATDATYRPAESNIIIQGLANLKNYYTQIIGAYFVTSAETTNIIIRPLGESSAYALCDFIWKYKPKANPDTEIDFYSRGSILLHKRGHQWRYLHMHESVKWSEPT